MRVSEDILPQAEEEELEDDEPVATADLGLQDLVNQLGGGGSGGGGLEDEDDADADGLANAAAAMQGDSDSDSDDDGNQQRQYVEPPLNRRNLVKEMIQHLLFLGLLYISVKSKREIPSAYRMFEAIQTIFIEEEFGDYNEKAYMDVANFEELWDWAEGVLAPGDRRPLRMPGRSLSSRRQAAASPPDDRPQPSSRRLCSLAASALSLACSLAGLR